ncbi:MAG: hypothetical protein ABUL71_03855 [Gemmatimonadota bacterium]
MIIVDRCVCKKTLFADLLPQVHANGWNLSALTAATGCGGQCTLCLPYLHAMIANQVTVFHAILPPLDAAGEHA